MKLLLSVISLVSGYSAFAAQPVIGTVKKEVSGMYLIADQRCARYSIMTKSQEAYGSLRRLESGDNITASGLLDAQTCTAVIESIDYVGLKKMLGYWYTQEGVITVNDYNSLHFYPINIQDFQNTTSVPVDPIAYRYSITPSGGKEWGLFLSDSTETLFATIEFNKTYAIMKFYDSETGAITKTLRLSKWGSLK